MARPRTYKTQGIVLKQTPLGEADRILVLCSPEMGKLRAVARGVRRITSRLRGHLEPLTHVLVSLSQGRNLDTIVEAQTNRSFRGLKEDLNRLSKAVYLTELVDGFSVEQSPSPAVFDLLLNALGWLQNAEDSAQMMRFFEVRLLDYSGFRPELYRCVECRTTLGPRDHLFSCSKGGILCPDCRVLSGDALLPLSLNGIKSLRYFQREPYEKVSELRVPKNVLDELERLLRTYIRYVLDRELTSAGFMHLVASTRPTGAVGEGDGR